MGGKVRFDEHGFISVEPAGIEEVEDVLKIKPGDPYGDNYMRVALETLEYMVQNCPAGYKVNPHAIMGPFTVGAQLRGISDFCADTIAEPELVEAVLDLVIETQVNFMKAQEKILGGPACITFWCATTCLPSSVRRPIRRSFCPPYERLFYPVPPHPEMGAQRLDCPAHRPGHLQGRHGGLAVSSQYLPQDALNLTENKVTSCWAD